jgi:hypothetical protein
MGKPKQTRALADNEAQANVTRNLRVSPAS